MSKNKDEEIKLYLSAITTRDPSKRQIKPVDKDAFQLFDDLDSGSDEDFVIGSDDLSDDQKAGSDENNSSDEDEENGDNESSSSESSSKDDDAVSEKNELGTEDIDKCSDDIKVISKTKVENVMICMMCLLDVSFSENEIVECDGCGIVVHEDCYKISDSVFMSCDASDSSTDPWFCDACLTNVHDPRCELCPAEGGVFKRTENNRWVHLLCALYTPGVAFNDIDNLSEITLSELPLREWSARECTLCSHPFYARTGVCISCDAGLCKNVFHVLCAQKEGLLSEPNNEENLDDPYFANCQQHSDKEVVKRRKKNWRAAVNRQKLRIEEWKTNDHYNDSRLIRKREFFASMYTKSLDSVPTPFVPLTKVHCFLETNPVAVFLFKKKATNLRLPQDVLNSQTSSDSKVVTSGIPVFGPDFITYFLDREKKIDETTSEIVRLEKLQRELQISEQNTSHQFNKTEAKKDSICKEYKESLEELLLKFNIIKQLIKNRDLIDVLDNLGSKFDNPTIITPGNGFGPESSRLSIDKDNSSNNKIDSVINECYMCKSVCDQHLLIDCDKCRKFIHIGCLDPPLTRMPRKTKLYGWQCSLCSCVSTDEDNEKEIDVNRPRQLRQSTDIRSRYAHIDTFSSTKKFTQQLLKKTRRRSMIKQARSKSLGDKPSRIRTRNSVESENQSTEKPEPIDKTCRELIVNLRNESLDESKLLLPQRKSDRPRKRPLTLLDEYEPFIKLKRPKNHKAIKSSTQTKSTSVASVTGSVCSQVVLMSGNDVNFTNMSNQSVDSSDHRLSKQPITFYPSSHSSISSKNSSESERVQIGVVAKRSSLSSKDCNSGNQKTLEKKSILIKCHDEMDDDNFPGTDPLGRYTPNNGRQLQQQHFFDI